MNLKLEVRPNPETSVIREFQDLPLVVGRDKNCGLTIFNHAVSMQHAELFCEEGRLVVRDLASTNGTFIDDRRVEGRGQAAIGSEIRFGSNGPFVRVVSLEPTVAAAPSESGSSVGPFGFAATSEHAVIRKAVVASDENRGPTPPAKPAAPRSASAALGPAAKAASPAGKGGPPANSAQPPKPKSTTRLMLFSLQEQQKRWRWAAIAASAALVLVAAVTITVIIVRMSGVTEEVAGVKGEVSHVKGEVTGVKGDVTKVKEDVDEKDRLTAQQLQNVSRDVKSVRSDLTRNKAINPAEINRMYGDAVFYVSFWDDSEKGYARATAFVIDARKGLFGTNAHVSRPVEVALKKGKKADLISQGRKQTFKITAAYTHTLYGSSTLKRPPDIGVLKATVPANVRLTEVKLATDRDLQDFGPGSQLCYIGFPAYPETTTSDSFIARVEQGVASRLLTYNLRDGKAGDKRIIEHTMRSWGGASGSPIFNREGKVVGLHFAGDVVHGSKQLASVKFAARVDALHDLLRTIN